MTPEQVHDLKEKICCLEMLENLAVVKGSRDAYSYVKGIKEGIIYVLTGEMHEHVKDQCEKAKPLFDIEQGIKAINKHISEKKSLL